MNPFNVKTVELSGANLIEASAGTGKTFSIAVLVVRLIIEKCIPVSEMLLVTFTEAAAAELKERSVKFIRAAIDEFEDQNSSGNDIIKAIVENYNEDKEAAKNRLYKALLDIDQAMMCTIHSFCQQTLNEFAFETKQAYGKELITDLGTISSKFRQAFIREEISTLPIPIVEIILPLFNSLSEKIIENDLAGKRYVASTNNQIDIESCTQQLNDYKMFRSNLISQDKLLEMKDVINNSSKKIVVKSRKSYLDKVSTIEKAIAALEKNDPKTFNNLFPVLSEQVLSRLEQIKSLTNVLKDWLITTFIDWISTKIQTTLKEKNLFTFDDLINQLYEVRMNVKLKELLDKKYNVVFIDEFQDTDQKQYDIFYNLFQVNPSKILFFIGDPKQSIYSWRKADLNTYYQARNSILSEKRYDMQVNFRSSKKLIDALNHFFKPTTDFDTFENGIEAIPENRIEYIKVSSANEDLIGLEKGIEEFPPIYVVNNHQSSDEINRSIELTFRQLLSGKFLLDKKNVKPSNICVLVRKNHQAKTVKDILNKLSIPSVISDDSKIIDSEESKELLYLLEAILLPQKSTIQKAFLTSFFNYNVTDIQNLDFDYYVELFTSYSKLWSKDGIYVALNTLISDFNIIKKLMKYQITGQRVISNLKQLIELLQEKELRNSFVPNETAIFLQNQIKTVTDSEVSEFAQRIENDEESVKIVTIHKSKGMEYDIVITPFLDFDEKEKFEFSSIRIAPVANQNNYVYVTNSIVDENLKELFEQQQRQENRRLIYVALTRAKYNLIILNQTHRRSGRGVRELNHSLRGFINEVTSSLERVHLVNHETLEKVQVGDLNIENSNTSNIPLPKINFIDQNFKKISYSSLASHSSKGIKELTESFEEGSYDQFVFKDLPKGAHTGNLLHDIFEFVDYTDDTQWKIIVEMLVTRYLPSKKEDLIFLDNLLSLVKNTLQVKIPFTDQSIQLYQLQRECRRNEFEFNFSLKDDFNGEQLENLLNDENRSIKVSSNYVKGLMIGFIDLFFEYEGKYYILDWKSNFLGDSLEDYDKEGVTKAMNESNYHLQYMIYALALEKYLKMKVKDFDFDKHFGGVIYMFLRGSRAGEQTGVYTQKVCCEELERLKSILKLS